MSQDLCIRSNEKRWALSPSFSRRAQASFWYHRNYVTWFHCTNSVLRTHFVCKPSNLVQALLPICKQNASVMTHSHEFVDGVTGLVANEMSVIAIAATELPIASAAEAAGCKQSLQAVKLQKEWHSFSVVPTHQRCGVPLHKLGAKRQTQKG